MLLTIAGVVAGYALWSVLWLAGQNLLFRSVGAQVESGQPFTLPGPLLGIIALSVVCSLAAGVVTALIARHTRNAVLTLAGLLLLTGIGVQASIWPLLPAWFHLTFLALIVPVTLGGAQIAARGARVSGESDRVRG